MPFHYRLNRFFSFRIISSTLILFGLTLVIPTGIIAQGINTDFGQNRVQYHEFVWSYYQSDNFVTYFYLGGQDLGKYVVEVGERELKDVESILDFKINSRIEILVFNDITDFNQSNIGLGLDINNTGGVTKIIGNRIFLYFDGDHNHLTKQIREGIAKVLVNNMIFGGSLQEVLQNAVLLNLPDWFVNGLVAYIGEYWSTDLDNALKDGIMTGRLKKFNKLTGRDALLAGHSFWYYVAEKYGKEAIPNLLYLTRINRSLENGFIFVLGYPYRDAITQWFQYFQKRYTTEEMIGTRVSDSLHTGPRLRKNRDYYHLRLCPDMQHMAFVSNQLGAWKVHLYNLIDGKSKVIARGGFKTKTLATDLSYPLIAWGPSGRKLVIISEKRDNIEMMIYDRESGEKEVKDIVKFQRIVDIAFTDNPRKLVMSAINRGQSDIYYFDINSKTVTQLTNDFYDDLEPSWVDFGNRKGIIFKSNRTNDTLSNVKFDTILPKHGYDLYFLNEMKSRKEVLLNLTHSQVAEEGYPDQIDNKHFTWLSDANGVRNRHAGYIDSIFSHFDYYLFYPDSTLVNPTGNIDSILLADNALLDSFRQVEVYKDTAYLFQITNNTRAILEQDILQKQGKIVDLVYTNGRYTFISSDIPEGIDISKGISSAHTGYMQKEMALLREREKPEEIKIKEDKAKQFFQTEFEDDTLNTRVEKTENKSAFRATKVLPYRVKFSTDYVLSQLDNSLIYNQYQSFIGNGPVYQTPDLSGLFTVSISDLMEDHRFTGGLRFPTSFTGSEYFLTYENLRTRLDKKLTYYRKVTYATYDFSPFWFNDVRGRQMTNYMEAQLKYPFDVLRSLRGKFGYRNYRISMLATDTFSLFLPDYTENWLSAKIEYVFDNTIETGLNLRNGTRYKVYYEAMKQFDLVFDPKFDFSFSKGFLSVFGFDVRHYQKVHRQMIWANRFSAATSFGSKKLIYYLGGVDNWMIPQFDNSIEVNQENNYAFQTLATNLRGFKQNIRNGNSYAVINSELRVPIFTYLFNTPIRSELIRNFQLVAFADIGTAWEGSSPYDEDNPFNTETIENGPVKVEVQYFRNPIVGGYGAGARTLLFGYFIRADVAWGIDSGERKGPIWYFSLSLDF